MDTQNKNNEINQTRNLFDTVFITGAMLLLVVVLISSLYSFTLALFILAAASVVAFFQSLPRRALLLFFNAKKVYPQEAPELIQTVEQVAQAAHLKDSPEVYAIPAIEKNAFTTKLDNRHVIVFSRGLIHSLNAREIAAVTAHEISHIKNNDLYLLNVARSLMHIIEFFSVFGAVQLIFTLPLLLQSQISLVYYIISLIGVFLAPGIARTLYFSLSRTREFQADSTALEITGDPEGLASALLKISYSVPNLFSRVMVQKNQASEERTHPLIEERIKKILGTIHPQ